ncbi:hypothetical protein M1349_04605 [Patescibacteria group bacterium]|nr:hypothetical protein [Patescibacteria group bacterium]
MSVNIDKDKLFGSHDFSHIERLLSYAKRINSIVKGNWKIIEASIMLHELTKNDLESTKNYLTDFTEDEVTQVRYCISKHSDFLNKPESIEAKIVQDCDLLDMLGAVGIARGFMSAGERRLSLKDAKDKYKIKRLTILNQLNLGESKQFAEDKIEFTKLFFTTIDKELSS